MRRLLWSLPLCLLALPAWAQLCPPNGWTVEQLDALKREAFVISEPATRENLALGLVECLGNSDPALRDGVAYEALAAWMRKGELPAATLREVRDRLYTSLSQTDPDGFRWPFAALVLSEVARTDRTQPWMTPAERATMVLRATAYLDAVRDYRGFNAQEGWRHGVAHGADWLAQLSLNKALDVPQLQRIVDAVAAQAVPPTGHAYVFGEPQRLAAPVVHAASRGLLDAAGWTKWFGALPARLGDPSLAWRDEAWLARRHDLVAFLQAVYVEADASDDKRAKAVLPGVTATLRALP